MNKQAYAIFWIMAAALLFSPGEAHGMGKTADMPDVNRRPYDYQVKGVETIGFDRGDFRLVLRARRFAQGNAVWAEIQWSPGAAGAKDLHMEFDGRPVALSKKDRDYAGMFAIAPDEKPGKKTIILYRDDSGRRINHHFELNVARADFKQYPRPINLGRFSNISLVPPPDVLAFIEACSRKKKEAFERKSPGVPGGPVYHPRDAHFITSPFWAGRKYLRYRVQRGKRIYLRPSSNAHSGVDLRGERGDPVFAMAAGKVVIAEGMYYEGNYIVIDHGSGVFSSYMHLDGFAVREGQKVRPGELIGYVGSTGLSTAAHLHVSFSIDGIHVDPISLLYAVPR